MSEQKLNEITDIVMQFLNYKAELQGHRSAQSSGLIVRGTQMNDFANRVDGFSQQLMKALETRNPDYLESLGELCLNAKHRLKQAETDRTLIF